MRALYELADGTFLLIGAYSEATVRRQPAAGRRRPNGFVLPFRAYRARERFQRLCLLAVVEYKGKEVHGLRHGAGTRTYTQFRDLRRVAQHLRQASAGTAMRYAKMTDKAVGDGIEEW